MAPDMNGTVTRAAPVPAADQSYRSWDRYVYIDGLAIDDDGEVDDS